MNIYQVYIAGYCLATVKVKIHQEVEETSPDTST